ncbi:MAG: amidohydrolase family protein [Alphaproteobacteria bacterium]|nr:amidohydrolase family protein [Alphaproteobacteria bacterium]
MSLDLVIRGGSVLDGTGAPARSADIGVRDGRIVELGVVSSSARRIVDADGALVTPGFVDLHTHYDGQATWDDELAPSIDHGVTTAVMGSCGVGFAPVRPTQHDQLIELMEGVEDIPGTALHEGLDWRWTDFPSYMDAVDALPHTMDLLCQVPHDVLRYYVMGERAAAGADSTDADRAEMKRLLEQALDAGAVGFSTGRSDNHRTARGEYTPASEASAAELVALGSAFAGRDRGVLQAVSDFDMNHSVARFHAEFDLLEGMAREAGGRPLSISTMQRDMAPDQWKWILQRAEAATAAGLPMRCQVASRPIGVLLGLEATFHPFMGMPGFKALSHLPRAELLAALRQPDVKARILSEDSDPVAGDGSPIPKMADEFLKALPLLSMRLFVLGQAPCYEPDPATALGAQAIAAGKNPLEAVYDAMLQDEGRALIYFPLFNYTAGNLDVVHRMLTHPLALPGLGDGGAHVGTICDASMPTWTLQWWGRDRPRDRIALPRLVQQLTADGADFLGLADRGRVAVGQRADLNVIDFDHLAVGAPRLHADLPAGGKRLLQPATGYLATVVAGQVVRESGRDTGARPGRVVRV